MPLAMPRPTKRLGTSHLQLIQRIPADVKTRVRGMRLTVPVGDHVAAVTVSAKAEDIRVSLRTRDPQEAKARQAVALGYLEGVWRAVREGPRRLTHKETVALAGEAYRDAINRFEDDPGTAEHWGKEEARNALAEHGHVQIKTLEDVRIRTEEGARAYALEKRFGGLADALLARRGLVVDSESRGRLIEQLVSADRQSNLTLRLRAEGDFTPDPAAGRFPAFPETKDGKGGVSLLDLFDGYARERGLPRTTTDQWRKHVADFIAFAERDDAGQMSKADVVAWKDKLLAEGRAPKTINDSKLAALRVAFKWGVDNVRVASNPAAGVVVNHKVRPGDRMQGFTDAEAATILKAAAASARPAIRWLPLLCATSGARVGEVAQLRAEDVFEEHGIPVVRITPEAGSLKNDNSERVIPVPPTAIKAGFLAFAKGRKGPLFYSAAKRSGSAKKPPHKIVAKNVAAWVGSLKIEGVGRAHRKDPNHAWRHRFHTKARTAGVLDSVADMITGRVAAPGSGGAYGKSETAAMLEAMGRIPVPEGALGGA